jgi:hypothetical protein
MDRACIEVSLSGYLRPHRYEFDVIFADELFAEWTSDDQLRQPVFLGLRTGKEAKISFSKWLAMSIFISWSETGSASHAIAKILHDWLPRVIQRTECYMSSLNNAAGSVWLKTILSQLEKSHVGIVCLTFDCRKFAQLLDKF